MTAISAFAQSAVTIYGIADVAYVSKTHTNLNGSTASKSSGIGEGFNAGNRIGFRGTEDLGSGLSANFVIEQGINLTNGQLFSTRAAASGQQVDGYGSASGNMPTGAYSTSTNRQAFVGLKDSNIGEVRAGYQYTALYTVSTNSGYHLGSEQPGGDLAHGILSNASFGGTRGNGITYISPTFSGVTATLQMGAGAGREEVEATAPANGRATDKNKRSSILLNYVNGPLSASYAHTSMKIEQAAAPVGAYPTTIFGSLGATAYTAASAAAVNQSNSLDQLAGSYQLGAAKLTASFASGKIDDSLTVANNAKTKAQQIGAEYAFGKIRPFVVTGTSVVKNSAGTKIFDADSTQFGIRYDLSKRTVAYVISGSVKDNAQSTPTSIQKREATAIGLFHTF